MDIILYTLPLICLTMGTAIAGTGLISAGGMVIGLAVGWLLFAPVLAGPLGSLGENLPLLGGWGRGFWQGVMYLLVVTLSSWLGHFVGEGVELFVAIHKTPIDEIPPDMTKPRKPFNKAWLRDCAAGTGLAVISFLIFFTVFFTSISQMLPDFTHKLLAKAPATNQIVLSLSRVGTVLAPQEMRTIMEKVTDGLV